MTDEINNGGLWLFAILALMWGGNGFGGFGGNRGFNSSIGYENLATSNEVQRGFDNQNAMANQREILGAVTAGTAQSVATTNQTYHDTINAFQDKYNELARDVYGVSGLVQQAMANQNECCCSTKMLIQENSAQNRYDAAMNTAGINANIAAGFNSIREKLDQNKIEALQNRIQQLELQAATGTTVKYPTTASYSVGFGPFCNNGCGCGAYA